LTELQIPRSIEASATLTLTRLAVAYTQLVMAEGALRVEQRARCSQRTVKLLDALMASLAVPGDTAVAPEWLAAIDEIALRLQDLNVE
jgi:hypothetical protein